MKIVNTLEEAEDVIDLYNLQHIQKFCPMIHSTCKSNCVCFISARHQEHHDEDAFTVYEAYCNNYSLMGGD